MKKSVSDAEIEIEGYKFFRKDRNFNINNNDIATKNSGVDYSSGGCCHVVYLNTGFETGQINIFICPASKINYISILKI